MRELTKTEMFHVKGGIFHTPPINVYMKIFRKIFKAVLSWF